MRRLHLSEDKNSLRPPPPNLLSGCHGSNKGGERGSSRDCKWESTSLVLLSFFLRSRPSSPALLALRFFFPRQPNNSIVLHLSRRAPVRRVSLSICKMNIFQVFNIYPSVSPLLRLPPLLHFPPLPHSQPWGHSIVNSLWFSELLELRWLAD